MSKRVTTIILAGGQGTRLHPLTIHHSKPAVHYGGRYRLIDIPISNSINSHFCHIFVIAQYLAEELQHYIQETYQFDSLEPVSVQVLTPHENGWGQKEWFKGTADAVRKNLPEILASPSDYYLILSGDQLYNIDFQTMVQFAEEKNADLTIACLPIPRKEASRMGILKISEERKVVDFVEKPTEEAVLKRFELSDAKYLGSMGIYIFKREALVRLLTEDPRDDFGYHLITTAVQEGNTYAYVYQGYWEDIGTVASYYEANLILTESARGLNTCDEKNPIYSRPTFLPGPKVSCLKINQSIICEGCVIEAAEISHSIIGVQSYIKQGSIIRDTVMMGNHDDLPSKETRFGVGENCLIEKAIIDENVTIGDNVRLINEKKLDRYEGNGIFIRDGIIIVTAGTVIPNNYVL